MTTKSIVTKRDLNVVSFSRKAGKVSKNVVKDPTSMIKTLYMLIKSVQAVELLKLDRILISSIEKSLIQLMHMLTELPNTSLIQFCEAIPLLTIASDLFPHLK